MTLAQLNKRSALQRAPEHRGHLFTYGGASASNGSTGQRYVALAESPNVFAVTLPRHYVENHRPEDIAALYNRTTVFTVKEIGQTGHVPSRTVFYTQPSRWQADYKEGGPAEAWRGEARVRPATWKTEAGSKMRERLQDIVHEHTRPSMSDIEKARALYGYLTANARYGETTPELKGVPLPSEFADNGYVCRYYADLYASLLQEAGVPAQTQNKKDWRDTFRGSVLHADGSDYGLVINPLFYSLEKDQYPDAVLVPDRTEYMTKLGRPTCHSWTEAWLGDYENLYPFDPTWDLGKQENDWDYFAGFRTNGNLYHPYQLEGTYARELPEWSLIHSRRASH